MGYGWGPGVSQTWTAAVKRAGASSRCPSWRPHHAFAAVAGPAIPLVPALRLTAAAACLALALIAEPSPHVSLPPSPCRPPLLVQTASPRASGFPSLLITLHLLPSP